MFKKDVTSVEYKFQFPWERLDGLITMLIAAKIKINGWD